MSRRSNRFPITPLLLALVWTLLSACFGAAREEEGAAPPPRAPLAESDLLILFEESSGEGRMERTLAVRKDGLLELHAGAFPPRRAQAPRTDVEELRRLVSDAGFRMLEARYAAPAGPGEREPGPLTTYRIRVSTEGEVRTVVTEEGARQPAVLRKAISDLKRLMTLAERQGTEYGI